MKKILVLQHEPSTPPALTLEWAKVNSITLDIRMVSEIIDWPTPSDYLGIIILGGSMDTWQESQFPWLKFEKQFLETALRLGTKIFGICLGCQLLAEVLGGKVIENPEWEIGWLPVELTEGTTHFAQYHKFKVSLPPKVLPLGRSQWCDTQGFTFQNQIIATQFHPEANSGWFSGNLPKGIISNSKNIQSKEQLLAGESNFLSTAQSWYFHQLNQLFS